MQVQTLTDREVWSFQRGRLKLLIAILRFPRLAYAMLSGAGHFMPELETAANSAVRHSFSMLGGGLVAPDDLAAMRYVYQEYLDHMDGVVEAGKNGKKVVWAEFNLSNELLRVFDVTAYIPESLSIMAHHMGTDVPVKMIEEAEAAGIPAEYCSAGKTAIGAYLLKQAPEPDLLISSSHPCDSVVSSYQVLSELSGAPLFAVDTPYWDDEQSFEYYAQNLSRLIGFLEKHTGQEMDWDRLARVCRTMNETNRWLSEYTEMARAVPSPMNLTCLLLGWQLSICATATERGAVYAKKIVQNAKKRLKAGRGFFDNQKIRVIWFDIPLAFHFIEPWLNKTFGAVTVADFMGCVKLCQIDTSDRETMLRDLAKAHLSIAMARQCRGPAEYFTGELARLAEDFSGDCFIFTRHQGCKTGWGMGKLVRDVCERAGKPALFLATDSFDKRCADEAQVKKEITEFFRENGLA
ncbi:MAG: 2-hydroxyacyl-CoA dehydratase family protein [Thermodesulfobacteriota bacterium]